METKVLEKGQVVTPASLRRLLGIKSGDRLKAEVKNGDIGLSPQPRSKYKTRIITSPITGLPVLTSGPNVPVLTNEMVEEILADFP
ncbi:MAG: AbrB/MazE/SpoVT family DNA-binding domain-containing protein [Pyrinomonadaceae bacterium]